MKTTILIAAGVVAFYLVMIHGTELGLQDTVQALIHW